MSDRLSVALKVPQRRDPWEKIRYHDATLKKIAESLEKEIAFLSRIAPKDAEHHHIIPLLDKGRFKGVPAMAMLRCDHAFTEIYDARLASPGTFPFAGAELLRWAAQICAALRFIHHADPNRKHGLRDLNLKNVLVRGRDLFVSDFGTVKELKNHLTRSHVGTPEWAAPEILIPRSREGGRDQYALTPRMDIYCLGLMLHALITGKPTAAQQRLAESRYRDLPFGSVGGLTEAEVAQLRAEATRLLRPPAQTLMPGAAPAPIGLPDVPALTEELCKLITAMLAPLTEDRPNAETTSHAVDRLNRLLTPRLETLSLTVRREIALDEGCVVHVSAHGAGLPEHGRWLHLFVADRSVVADFQPAGPGQWQACLPPFDRKGRFEIRVTAWVGERRFASANRCFDDSVI